jgi:hypothetical protein
MSVDFTFHLITSAAYYSSKHTGPVVMVKTSGAGFPFVRAEIYPALTHLAVLHSQDILLNPLVCNLLIQFPFLLATSVTVQNVLIPIPLESKTVCGFVSLATAPTRFFTIHFCATTSAAKLMCEVGNGFYLFALLALSLWRSRLSINFCERKRLANSLELGLLEGRWPCQHFIPVVHELIPRRTLNDSRPTSFTSPTQQFALHHHH